MSDVHAPLTYALGDSGALPFRGHFRVEVRGPGSVLRVSGRLAADAEVVRAHHAAATVERKVRGVVAASADASSRHALLRALWQAFQLGEEFGEDAMSLGLVAVAADRGGVSLSGVGLSGAWYALAGRAPRPLVPPDHPLLTSALGVPASLPGAMTLPMVPDVLVVEVRHPSHAPNGLPSGDLRAACGVRG